MAQESNNLGKKSLLGAFISFVLIAVLLYQFDLSALESLDVDITFTTCLTLLGLVLAQLIVIGYRWSIVNQIGFGISYKSSVLAYGANTVLPARGGDILRISYLKKTKHSGAMTGIVSLVIEKICDLVAILLIMSLWFQLYKNTHSTITAIPTLISAVLLVVLYLILYQRQGLIQLGDWIFKTLLKSAKLSSLFQQAMEAIEIKYQASDYLKIVLSTSLLWLVVYPAFYLFVLDFLGIETSLNAIYLIIAIAGLGVAIPSAPSGIGVFHAAVISAMLILDYGYDESFIAATVLHLFLTIPVILISGATYYFHLYTSRSN